MSTALSRLLILASSSPRRRDLMAEYGYPCEIIPAQVEEVTPAHLTVGEIAVFNARLKAREVAARFPEARVLGVDTLVSLEGEPIGKPADMEEAFAMVSRLSGRTHEVYSGVALICAATGEEQTALDVSHVRFHPLTAAAIRRYHARINPLDKAGAYAAQDTEVSSVVCEIIGSRTNVIGLPMELLERILSR